VVIPVNLIFTVVTGILVYLMARRLFDQRVAQLSMTLFFLSDAVWSLAITGTGASVAVAWCALATYAALLAATPPAEGAARWPAWLALAFCALFSALAFLTRYSTVILVPALALYLAWSARQRKGLVLAVYAGLFAVFITPWLVRNWVRPFDRQRF